MIRRLAHEPFGWRPTTLLVTVRRYRCTGCGHVWRQDTSRGRRAAGEAVAPRRCGGRWKASWCQHLTVARVAEALGGVVEHRQRRRPGRGPAGADRRPAPVRRRARSIGVDEHVWRHTRRGDKYVTVIIDLTPIRDGTGPARLLDMVEGRSKQAFKTWLAERAAGLARRGRGRRDGRVHRVQDRHHRGAARRRRGDGPLPRRPPGRRRAGPLPPPRPARPSTATAAAPAIRSTGPAAPCTPAPTCSPTSRRERLDALFAADEHVEVEATWGIYQRMIAAYREPDRARGRELMSKLIDSRQPRRPRRADRGHHPRPDPEEARRRRAGLLRPARHQQRTRPRRSTAASNTSAAPPSASATSPTTSPDPCSRPADSDPDYTLDCEEPVLFADQRRRHRQRSSAAKVGTSLAEPRPAHRPSLV